MINWTKFSDAQPPIDKLIVAIRNGEPSEAHILMLNKDGLRGYYKNYSGLVYLNTTPPEANFTHWAIITSPEKV